MPQLVVMARWGAVITLAVSYTLLAHHTNTTPGNETLGAFLALGPILLAAFSIAWRSQHRTFLLALLAAGCIALFAAWGTIEHHYSRIYWIEHAGTQCILCLAFARTLGRGREPMCSYFAGIVHGPLTPMLKRYTRHVTIAWVAFFGMMAATSTVIFFAAPLSTWSTFAYFFTAPLTGLMFIGEYAVRRYVHLDMEHVHILAAVKAFWNAPAIH
ncbi:MAG: hypothetical protein ABI575_00255 [Oxalobacteraceae bacterium]